jgi:vitamin B12/bleomycin/antimicrobial peptide transport system ATP-binding/permease protein
MVHYFDYRLFRQFWRVGKLYWFSREKWQAFGLLILLVFLSFLGTGLLVLLTVFLGELESSLAAIDKERFFQTIAILLVTLVVGILVASSKVYVQGKISLYWRRWLTNYFLYQYLQKQNFYHLSAYSEIDNPDQRVSEDIQNFTQQFLYFAVVLCDSILQLIGFSGVLWRTSQPLMVFLIVYAIVGTAITTTVFGRILVGINFEQLKREADFRYGLIRVRDNAEAIAFYQGENVESQELGERLLRVLINYARLIRWQLGLDLFQNSYQYITFLLPTIVLAPRILAGELEIGVSAQAGVAFRSILISLGLIISQFQQLSALAAATTRLDDLQNTIFILENPSTFTTHVKRIENSYIGFENVTLQTPDAQKIIVEDLSFTLSQGESLLIIGKSGVGKTSLLRAIAGLWNYGIGTIIRPTQTDQNLSHLLFLPQRPYMVLGTLRQQLLYPYLNRTVEDDELLQVLQQVNLLNLIEKGIELDTVEDWGRILSVGEQQRLSFARLLLHSPQYAILDEATSALDEENQSLLYDLLQKTRISYISVGHRSSLRSFHQRVLELQGDGRYSLI